MKIIKNIEILIDQLIPKNNSNNNNKINNNKISNNKNNHNKNNHNKNQIINSCIDPI